MFKLELCVEVFAVVFDGAGSPIVCFDDSTYSGHDDSMMRLELYPDATRGAFVNAEDTQEKFFAIWSEDCFSPSINVVRADSFSEAIDIAVDAVDGLKVDADQYGGEEEFQRAVEDGIVGVSGDGVYYDAERINGRELTMVRVDVRKPAKA